MTSQTVDLNIDEFGRDLSLKSEMIFKKYMALSDELFGRFKGMSWIDIDYMLEDEEEDQKQLIKKETLQTLILERKELYSKGEYELEDGEELEF
jgi:hypothetical protein